MPPLSLLPAADFESVFASFQGRRVGFVPLTGNTGDRMIDAAAMQLFSHFGINHTRIDKQDLTPDLRLQGFEALAVSGGGNFGRTYAHTYETRRLALATGLPVTVLPQSIVDRGETAADYHRVFVRESASLAYGPALELAPDLALGYRLEHEPTEPRFGVGVFLRSDWESVQLDRSRSLADPIKLCRSLESFLALAGLFERVVTDRLHFCIAALACGRRVHLLPNAYHKNRSMFETWLHQFSCEWLDRLDGIDSEVTLELDSRAVRSALEAALGAVPASESESG